MSFSIVIPSRNATNLVACIKAIRDVGGETSRIIVVDDGVDFNEWECRGLVNDDLWQLGVELVDGVKPFCYARNCNLGIRAAGEDDVILLNDDALLKTPEGFSKLHAIAQHNMAYGIISSSCNNVGNMNQQHRGLPNFPVLRHEPRMVCFIAVLIKRSTIKHVAEYEEESGTCEHFPGLLDQRFGSGGFEDDDYCLRVRRAGLKIGIFDGCFVDHTSLESTFRVPGGPGYNPRGADIFREKWGAGNHDL